MIEKEGLRQKAQKNGEVEDTEGAVVRIGINTKDIYLVFSADSYGEGASHILDVLKSNNAGGSFFLTEIFCAIPPTPLLIKRIISSGHYIGPHSDKHLLYNSWENRDSVLVTKETFVEDLKSNYMELIKKGAPAR
ncbi:MAG: polysaccharide deacetylase family protein [Marinilabiliales bacterium]|nr:polysaccharide deacetylase family protein [Marinilabiliales bacterium]